MKPTMDEVKDEYEKLEFLLSAVLRFHIPYTFCMIPPCQILLDVAVKESKLNNRSIEGCFNKTRFHTSRRTGDWVTPP